MVLEYVQRVCAEGNGIQIVTAILLFVAAVLAWKIEDIGVYVALTAIVGGGFGVVCSACQVGWIAGVPWLFIWGGSLYLCLLGTYLLLVFDLQSYIFILNYT